MKQIWIVVGLAMIAGLGISAAVIGPIHPKVNASTQKVTGSEGAAPGTALATACVGPRRSGVSQEFLADETQSARTLVSERRFADALPQLREVAIADPGFPGVNLDIAIALLQTGQPAAAREAADRQMAASECLAALPPDALAAYCSGEFPQSPVDRCTTQLAYIWHSAQLQTELLDLRLAHSAEPHAGDTARLQAPAATSSEPEERRPRRASAGRTGGHRSGNDHSLEDGEGTDSALGAYSKQ